MHTLNNFLQEHKKAIYVTLLAVLTLFLLMEYIPVLAPYSEWVTPPVALFVGLAFALICGQAHPKSIKRLRNIYFNIRW